MSVEKIESFIDVPKEGFFFMALGGVGEIGMNFYLYACDNQWIIVDCGIGFAGDTLPGIDILLPDPKFIEQISRNIKAIIITHAHEDHIGAVATFWQAFHCPVYVSPFATEMLETRLDEASLLGRVPVHTFEEGDLLEIAPFEIELVPVNHSIPESTALLIKTPYGNVFHTGDWRFDDAPVIGKPADYKRLKALKKEKILAVVGDSTNAGVEEDSFSERDVKKSLSELFVKYQGRGLLVTCFASNVGRIESIAQAALDCGRSVCLIGRSLWRIEGAARACGYFENLPQFLTTQEAKDYRRSEILYLCTGCQGEPKAALSQISYDSKKLTLQKGDVVVFSSKVIPGNERAIQNIRNRIILKGVEIVTTDEALVHVSGHANAKDIAKLYSFLKPKIAIPVHGEDAHLFLHELIAKEAGVPQTLLIKDGDVVRLDEKNLEILGQVPTGALARDGNRIIEVQSPILKQRKKMLYEGTIVATIFLNSESQLIGDVLFSTVGLLEKDDPVIEEMNCAVKKGLETLVSQGQTDDEAITEMAVTTVRKIIALTQKRRPLVEVHLGRA